MHIRCIGKILDLKRYTKALSHYGEFSGNLLTTKVAENQIARKFNHVNHKRRTCTGNTEVVYIS